MYQLSDGIRRTHSREGLTILDVRRGQMFNLNITGSRILELLQNGLEAAEIVEKITFEFSINPATADRDVQEFTAELESQKVIERISSERDRR